ncbi:hypothetical protein B7712_03480 [Streptococcus oralis subsp. oralis]|uniref:Uncharacterized protein n=1 Tax=Streptococcus oralis subsp. oralis TaxID=1891914 RepID=A0A1X1I4E6_STROR|nr:hypothetical protein B7723_02380 [Streptococcus oralis subsp. oralis]ORO67996.1 hypothetical protein B7713_05040 [Streptococcus oralis subsp. oralis]ORO72887.1 hypothetical protein B7712_03480 [Streptococcus oralis subsp. oralis]
MEFIIPYIEEQFSLLTILCRKKKVVLSYLQFILVLNKNLKISFIYKARSYKTWLSSEKGDHL